MTKTMPTNVREGRSRAMRVFLSLILAAVSTGSVRARTASVADELCRLTPGDVAAALVVEHWSGSANAFYRSPFYQKLFKLSAAEEWRKSDAHRNWRGFLDRAEKTLGMPADRARDELFGEAVVLALHLPADAPLDSARGLLVSRVRDLKIARDLIAKLDAAEREGGRLVEVLERRRAGLVYRVRVFPADAKPTEFYALLDDKTLVWSNSEELLQAVLDRSAAKGDERRKWVGLSDLPGFRDVRDGLPTGTVASLYVNPRVWEKRVEFAGAGDETLALIRRVLHAIECAAIGLEARDGLILHLRATLRRESLPDSFTRLAGADRPEEVAALSRRVPADAFAIVVGRVDFVAAYDAIREALESHPAAALFGTLAKGILLGKNVREEILPRVGPGFLVYARAEADKPPEIVAATTLADDPIVSAALENAARTSFAMIGLALIERSKKQGGAPSTPPVLESAPEGDAILLGLSGRRFSIGVARLMFVVASSRDCLRSFLATKPAEVPSTARERLRERFFADSIAVAQVDLDRLREAIEPRRERLARVLSDARGDDRVSTLRDLDRALELSRLFRTVFLAVSIGRDAASIHLRLGLIADR